MSLADEMIKDIVKEILIEGGAGSGNWGHKGRPGRRGGSLPTKGGSILRYVAKSSRGAVRTPKFKPFKFKMPRLSGKLYRSARRANDIEAILSGSPRRMLKRVINKLIGRFFISRLFR